MRFVLLTTSYKTTGLLRNYHFVGSSADANKHIGDKTEVVDLEERLVLPGIIDSHMHVRIAGQMNSVMLNLFPTIGGHRETAEK
jgi:predicted amidohydrolase YtcJ